MRARWLHLASAPLLLQCAAVAAKSSHQQNLYLESVSYQGISASGCTRLLDANGVYGCTAPSTTAGVLYRVASQADIDGFSSNTPQGVSYTAVMPTSLLTKNTIATMKASGRLAGILLIKDSSSAPPASYSIDSTTPNAQFGLYANQSKSSWHIWNPQGNDIISANLDVPIFGLYNFDQVSKQSIGTINEALDFNSARGYTSYPLYSMQFDGLMWAARNSQTCLRRNWCLPVGGYSVWSTFSTNFSLADNKPIIFVNAKMDSTALIHDYAFGAIQRSGLITMLAVMEALSRAPTSMASLPKTVIFAAFNAETWSFAGSQRFVLDLKTPFTCRDSSEEPTTGCPISDAQCKAPCRLSTAYTNISLNLIESIVEFDTVGGISTSNAPTGHYVHVDSVTAQTKALADQISGNFTGTAVGTPSSISAAISQAFTDTKNNRLPPSSAMSFLAARNIPAVVISDYQENFSNRFFNSELDDGSAWGQNNVDSLCGIAGATANSIYKLAGGTPANSITPNCTLVGALLDCFTRNISCPLLSRYDKNNVFMPPLVTGYSSVFSPGILQILPQYISMLMADWTASARLGNCSDPMCTSQTPGYSCVANQCILSMTQLHQAYATGLTMDDATGTFSVSDPTKGTWTESTWQFFRARIFKTPSVGYQAAQIVTGIILTIVAVLITLYLQKRGFSW